MDCKFEISTIVADGFKFLTTVFSYYQSVSSGWTLTTTVTAAAPYADNSFYKIRWNTSALSVGSTATGSITFGVRSDAPRELQVKLGATCGRVEKIWMNNYQVQMLYIEKTVADN